MAFTSDNFDDLEHDILLNEALLASLDADDTDESRRDRVVIQRKLDGLRQRLQSQVSLPNWGSTTSMGQTASRSVDQRPGSSTSEDPPALTPSSDAGSMPPPPKFLALPSRKRMRNTVADEDDDDDSLPEPKSFRPSPALSGAPSPASTPESIDFSFEDDPDMQQLFGFSAKQEWKENQQYLRELERKRKQEKEDEEFARQLAAADDIGVPPASQPYRSSSANYYQTTFRPDASSLRPRLPPPAPVHPVKPEPPPSAYSSSHGYTPYSNSTSSLDPRSAYVYSTTADGRPLLPPSWQTDMSVAQTSTPTSWPNSDSEIEEISANDFILHTNSQRRSNKGYGFQSAGNSQNAPFTSNQIMPGAFPGDSFAGNSAYKALPMPGSFPGISGQAHDLFATTTGFGMAGSSSQPLDLDAYNAAFSAGLHDYYRDPAKTQEEILSLIKNIRPDEEVKPEERQGTPEQLKCTLLEHQKLGLAWMKKMEEGTNKGGILADDMGLGKTIQALALIVSRPPPPGVRRPTLVVAPVALMEQWKRETEKMVKPQYALKVFILHGTSRHASWNVLRNQDIVITTYGQLASDLKRKHDWEEKLKLNPDATPTLHEYSPILGAQSRFHRVILDEAQWIKNKSTKSAVAACQIQSEYRWCMTGTPMQNKVEELFTLIKFCRIRPYNEDDKFSRDFTRPLKAMSKTGQDKAMRQLQALLKAILLRRTKTSTIDGKPILNLPPKTTKEARAVFSEDEMTFYKALEGKAQIVFNKYMAAGTVGRNYTNVLVLLLRLRQACCHPHLIKDFAINTGALVEGVDEMENARSLPKAVVERIRAMEGAFECPICLDAAENPVIFNPCGHALCNDCLVSLVDTITRAGEGSDPACPHCRAKINTNKITTHMAFMKVYSPELLPEDANEAEEEDDEATDSDEDSSEAEDSDDDDGGDLKDFIVDDEEEEEEEEIVYDSDDDSNSKNKSLAQNEADVKKPGKSKKSKKSKGKGKGKAKDDHRSLAQLRREGLKNKAAKKKYLRRLNKTWVTSAKIEKTLELLESIHARGDGSKTIIFSAFTSMLDLLEVPLHRHPDLNVYARYDGSMPVKSRNEAVLDFTGNPNCTIMLVSLKAGNAGLNLTAASQVIILDPHWNPFVELQAADRAYRIGQMREVEVHRVLIDAGGMEADQDGTVTVEDRILALQEKKQKLVDNALDENAGNSVARLGVRELGYLFGVNSINAE